MNPALLLVVLLLTPTTLREDKNFLEDEITLLEKRIIEIEDQINEIDITIDLHCGKEWEEVFTCDLSYDYVKINAEYTT